MMGKARKQNRYSESTFSDLFASLIELLMKQTDVYDD